MSKYTIKQLRSMAKTLLKAKAEADERYLLFVINLSFLIGLDADEIEQQIVAMANGTERR